ncbi:MAG: helix-turn-helix domain-containing protein, partial [Bacteroidota bacterium]
QEDKVKGIVKGADSYLQKPFNRKELLAIIEQLLKNKKRFQQYFQQTKNNSNAQSDFLTIVQNCIQENLDNENFGLLQLQQATRLSRVQLYRKVKALTNQSPSELIRSTRMKAASNLIENSDLSINEIAFQVGFKDTSHFIKTYKKHFKKTPNETRKNL